MIEAPNILSAQATKDRNIIIHFENGLKACFNFEKYYNYSGYYSFLKNVNSFENIKFRDNYIYWINKSGEEIEIDSAIIYSICSQKKIVINGKTVFDPALGKESWL